MEMLAIVVVAGVVLILPTVAFVMALVAFVRLHRLDRRLRDLQVDLELEVGRRERAEAAAAVVAPAVAPAQPTATLPPVSPAVPSPPPPAGLPPLAPEPVAAAEPAPIPAVPAEPAAAAPAEPIAAPSPEAPPLPPRPERVEPPAVEEAPPGEAPPSPPFDWESLVGVKLFSWIAGVALVIAAALFLRYSVAQGWLSPPVRMAIGLLTGVVLLVVCELKAAQRYRITANALDGAAIAVLYATFFAANVLWHLVGMLPTFGLMALVTAVAVLLAVRRDSLFIALLGLVGGFATPALLSTGVDRPIGLFGYLLLLNIGLAWVAYHKRWPALTTLTVVLTALYQWAWVLRFLDASRLPLAVGIFLVFPLASLVALALGERLRGEGESAARRGGLFGRTANLSVVLPLLFALYLAAVPAYGEQWVVLLGFLLFLDLGLTAVALWRGPVELHLAGGASTLLVLAVWFARSYQTSAWPGLLGFLAVLVALYLAAPVLAGRLRRPLLGLAASSDLVAPLLLFVFPVLVAVEQACAKPALLFSALFLLVAVIAAVAVARERGALHFVAAFFAVATEAVWSARHLEQERLLPALLVYGAFALLYLGVPVLSRRLGRPLRPEGSAAVLLLVSLALLLFLTGSAVAEAALWGLALLLLVLNAGLLVEGAAGRFPALTAAGLVLSWIVLAVWWASARVVVVLVPALLVVAGLGVLAVAGSLLAGRRSEAAGRPSAALGGAMYLGLVGHLFLLFVASQPGLAVPPWPLLGVLAVLDLAAAVAALAARHGALQVGAVGGSGLVLVVFLGAVHEAPWPRVAVLAALAVAALALALTALSRRVLPAAAAAQRDLSVVAAAGALLIGQGVAIVASTEPGAPSLSFLLLVQVALAVTLLALAGWRAWHPLAVVATVVSFVALGVWRWVVTPTWDQVLLFAGILYAVYVAYPLLLGRRAEKGRWPWLAAVVASALAFLFARPALAARYGGVIALLPVSQAAVLAGLLWRLLRLEPADGRDQGRLALVAGAALAFVTVAIPLQLDKEWITIGWALEGAALAWLYTRIRHRGLLATAVGLLAVVFVRLAFNPAVLAYHERGAMRVFNWYLYAYLVSAAAIFVAAWFCRRCDASLHEELPRPATQLPVLATVLLFLLLNIEIADWFSSGATLTFSFSGSLAQDMSYTLGWAVFAIGLLAAGVLARSRATRVASIALLAATVVKAFLHDLARLGGLYRVASFVGLAFSLAVVAVALQRFVLVRPSEEEK